MTESTATLDTAAGPGEDDLALTSEPADDPVDDRGLWSFLKSDRRALVVLASATLLLFALTIYLAWKLGYAADEGSHFAAVHFQARHLRLADWETFEYGALRGHSYHLYSPATYLPYMPFDWLSSFVGPFGGGKPEYFVVRLGGLVVTVLQLAVLLALARRMIRRATPLQVVAIAVAVSLLPQLRYLHATINSDAMTILVSTLAFAVALRVVQRPSVTLRDAVLVGGTLGAAAHMRYNSFVAVAVLVVVFAVVLLRQPATLHTRLRMLGVAIAIPLLVAVPFHLHVIAELKNGHVVASSDHEELRSSTFDGIVSVMPPVGKRLDIARSASGDIWMGMWAWYPRYFELRGLWRTGLVLLVATGFVGLAVDRRRLLTRTGAFLALAAIAATLVTWAFMAVSWPFGSQGRFLLPAGLTALAGLVLGTASLLDRVPRLRHGILVAAGAWSAVFVFLQIMAARSITT